jgi:hypothetical protein
MATGVVTRRAAPSNRTSAGRTAESRLAGIRSEAVERATGKTWDQWLHTLDKDGASSLSHKAIARVVHDKHGVGPWWSQMVTVGYEQGRGLRQKHEMKDGFRISGSKTVNVPLKALYRAWSDETTRERWLPDADMKVRASVAHRSMRITWDASSPRPANVVVAFYSKGDSKSQVTVEHGKLPTAAAGERARKFWNGRLTALASMLES